MFGQIYIYTHTHSVTYCSFQCHQDEQILNGEVGKMEEQSNKCVVEGGGTRDAVVVTGMEEGSGGWGSCCC